MEYIQIEELKKKAIVTKTRKRLYIPSFAIMAFILIKIIIRNIIHILEINTQLAVTTRAINLITKE